MKKFCMATLFFLLANIACALPVGNLADTSLLCESIFWEGFKDPCFTWCDMVSLRIGFAGNYVYNRKLESDETNENKEIRTTNITTNAGFLALNLWNRLDIFTTLGTTQLTLIMTPNVENRFTGNQGNTSIRTNTDFSWSVGLRGTLWRYHCLILGAAAEYFYTKPSINWNHRAQSAFIYLNNSHLKYREWQVGLGVSAPIPMGGSVLFIPYIATDWGKVRIKTDPLLIANNPSINKFQNTRNWGFATGATLAIGNRWSFTVEGDFINEKAIAINSQFQF